MKKFITMMLVSILTFSLVGCGTAQITIDDAKTPYATAPVSFAGEDMIVTVDLSDGYSVEFSSNAVYLFNGEVDDHGEQVVVGYGWFIDQEEYDSWLTSSKDLKSFEEIQNGFKIVAEDGATRYLYSVTDTIYYMILVNAGFDAGRTFNRFNPEVDPLSDSGVEQLGINYMILVNKENELPEDWEDNLTTSVITNSLGEEVVVETNAYKAYLDLSEELADEGINIQLDSAYRSVEDQQKIWDDFMEKYGEEYTKNTVAVPGRSEHQTGLALDLYLNIDGKDVYLNEDMMQYPEVWAKIHEKLAAHGFILRYPEGKEDITGYSYEPWHIRYIGSSELAQEITDNGLTLEEYLD